MIPHTPAPWKVLREGRHLYVVDEQEVTVATVTLQPLEPEWQAGNANLLAAAPALYEALRDAHEELSNWTEDADLPDNTREVFNRITAALAQAEREAA